MDNFRVQRRRWHPPQDLSVNPPPPSYLARLQDFVSENRRAILVCTAAAAVALGAAYYDRQKDKRKDKPSSKKKKSEEDGPVLEEIKPKEEEQRMYTLDVYFVYAHGLFMCVENVPLTLEEIAAMSSTHTLSLRHVFQERKSERAAELYTQAIQPRFHSNRAACYMNMSPPEFERVVEDCDAALRHDPNYVKALNRRANALEALSRYAEALRDFTAATILDRFQNEAAAQSVERVLKKAGDGESPDSCGCEEPRLPSQTFISAYFAAFRKRTGDQTLLLALDALEAADYPHALSLVNEAVDQGGAKADLEQSLALSPSLTHVHMEEGNHAQAMECFDNAIKVDSSDPDVSTIGDRVLHFITNDYAAAAENYTKSTSLDSTFYKMGNVANSMATFRRTMTAFPNRAEVCNYYGELLLDQQRFEDAVEKFDRAIELEKTKALAIFQWHKDIHRAEALCREALAIDPSCEPAVATLAPNSPYK
ncbi:hypothetical protein EDC04DRAFT_2866273 [Pisolithus marmoratus]|nr:hypothetical protein EDC04DRAFT_2866273 [Pisolithus marmoratus]